MAKMKIEFNHQWQRAHGMRFKDRVIAYLPRWAPWAARLPWLANLRDALPGAARLTEKWSGLSAREIAAALAPRHVPARAPRRCRLQRRRRRAVRRHVHQILRAGKRPRGAGGAEGGGLSGRGRASRRDDAEPVRPLCCGRTYLASGLVDEAKREARRMIAALAPHVERGACGRRDRAVVPALAARRVPGDGAGRRRPAPGRESAADRGIPGARATRQDGCACRSSRCRKSARSLHGHCHQKAFDAFTPATRRPALVPGLAVEVVESSCCGMAGSFGYEAAHYDISMRMAELSLLPAVRAADRRDADRRRRHELPAPDRRWRGQREDAVHVVRVLARALDPARHAVRHDRRAHAALRASGGSPMRRRVALLLPLIAMAAISAALRRRPTRSKSSTRTRSPARCAS